MKNGDLLSHRIGQDVRPVDVRRGIAEQIVVLKKHIAI